MDWYLKVMRNYFNVEGRARRKEYWMFILGYFILAIVAGILDSIIGLQLVTGLLVLTHLIPNITAGVRRLHDIGRSGWFLLIGLIPLVGWIVVIYWMVQDSAAGANMYGPNPKAIAD